VSKKSKNITVVQPGGTGSDQILQQTNAPGITSAIPVGDNNQLEGSELFSFFTANIIKEEKVFTR
jgi:hypothetical protein